MAARGSEQRALAALVEGTRLVAAAVDLEQALDALAAQTRTLLDADDVTISLVVHGTDQLVRERPSALAVPASPFAAVGGPVESNELTLGGDRSGRAVYAADMHADPRIPPAVRAAFPTVVSALYVPLQAEAQRLGMLIALWTRPRRLSAAELRAAEALGSHAAIAVRGARLLSQARRAQSEAERARAELEAVFDASDASILVFGLDGALLRSNNRARERYPVLFGGLPRTLADLRALAGATHPDGTPIGVEWDAAARGQVLDMVVHVRDRRDDPHWIHAHVAGVRSPDGSLVAVVLLTRDITELHEAITARARLDGAVLTARRAAHELNNQLAPVVGYGEMLVDQLDGQAAELAEQMHAAAVDAARTLDQLQRIIRFEQTEFGGQPMLDLDAATSPRQAQP